MQCDVCGTKENIAGVASSVTGPISFCFCHKCLHAQAEPEWTFEYLYSFVGTEGEGLAEWVSAMQTFKDSRYWTWDEWTAWRKDHQPPQEQSS